MNPDGYEQKVIAKVIILRKSGLSYRKIADDLTELGYEPRKLKKKVKGRTVEVSGKWHFGTIRNILSRIEAEKKNK